MPRGDWPRTWLAALVLAATAFALIERWARADGGAARNVPDSPALWARSRDLAARAGSDAVVFIGSSRCLAGIAHGSVRREWPGCVVAQLAIDGSSALPVLEDLADDPAVSGLVVFEYYPAMIHRRDIDPESEARRWIADYRSGTTLAARDRVERDLGSAIRLVAFQNRRYAPLQLLKRAFGLDDERSAAVSYEFLPERSLLIDFHRHAASGASIGDLASLRCPSDAASLRPTWERVRRASSRIEAHGGRVVLVHFPSGRDDADRAVCDLPRATYWEPLVAATGLPAVHCADVPDLAAYHCPDSGHLDRASAPGFTTDLVRELEAVTGAVGDDRCERWRRAPRAPLP